MAVVMNPLIDHAHDALLIARADDDGFRLHQYETEHGQIVWEWQRGTEPRPQFVSRRVALRWMHDWLEMQSDPAHEDDNWPTDEASR